MGLEFLSIEDVLAIHENQISLYGGTPEIRDRGLLAFAVETPRATFDGQLLHNGPFEIAAGYLFHLVQNHPFIDGNKRTGTADALVFLDLNHIQVDLSDDELVELVLGIAQSRIGKPEIAEFLRRHQIKHDHW